MGFSRRGGRMKKEQLINRVNSLEEFSEFDTKLLTKTELLAILGYCDA